MSPRSKIYILAALAIAAVLLGFGSESGDSGINLERGVLCDIGRHFGFCGDLRDAASQ
ncbi:MAG: hypothetical protein KF914_08850 [Rhizobiaceae bacterium]|nr:hypothetical protein [Rhizobiaceae bacterium]